MYFTQETEKHALTLFCLHLATSVTTCNGGDAVDNGPECSTCSSGFTITDDFECASKWIFTYFPARAPCESIAITSPV